MDAHSDWIHTLSSKHAQIYDHSDVLEISSAIADSNVLVTLNR